jgi:hypothetical protein
MTETNIDRELGWDDPIENDGPDFEVLPAGDYDFEVVGFERARHAGSEKMPPCNKAVISIKVKGEKGQSTIKHNLFLHTKTEGLLCAFFVGIGQRKHGQKVTMDWNKVVGSKGRCKISERKWKNDKGEELTFNDIKKFYEPADAAAGYVPGRF